MCAQSIAGDAGVGALPPGHPSLAAPAPGPLPSGHPPTAVGQSTATPELRQFEIPPQGVADAASLPAGVLLVRIVDVGGDGVVGQIVRLTEVREGERSRMREATTRFDGSAQFDGLRGGPTGGYRASIESGGATMSTALFQMPSNTGMNAQIVRFDVTDVLSEKVAVLDAQLEVTFRDDRAVVHQSFSLINITNVSLHGETPTPVAYLPRGGLRFRLPRGFLAFSAGETSSDDRTIEEEDGYAVVRGVIPPSGIAAAANVSFSYHLRVTGPELPLEFTMPLQILHLQVLAQASASMQLNVEGLPPAEERSINGQRVLATERSSMPRRASPLEQVRIRLTGIPSSTGPWRNIAAVLAFGIVALSFAMVIDRAHDRRGGDNGGPSRADLEAERDSLVAAAQRLDRDHRARIVGPETYERRRRELVLALAATLTVLDARTEAAPPRGAETKGSGRAGR